NTKKMNKIIIGFFALSISVIGVFAQHDIGPRLVMDVDYIDYGKVRQGSNPYRTFTIKNIGVQPLLIKSIRSSCGCLVGTGPTEPILPGMSAEFKVRYDTQRVGPFTKVITLTTNEKIELHTLDVKGNVIPLPSGNTTPVLIRPNN
ncbi:MAG TPA: hypothetical protein DIW24_04215, partial [Bacteroidetes bacterium]|nr:hypothetical protein [Bacteroidota bacterium]